MVSGIAAEECIVLDTHLYSSSPVWHPFLGRIGGKGRANGRARKGETLSGNGRKGTANVQSMNLRSVKTHKTQ